jgi:hypothetical protein
MSLAASPSGVVRRWTRSVLTFTLAIGLAGSLGACSDDDPTSPSNLNGAYSIQSFDGRSASEQGITGEFVLTTGDRWTLFLEGSLDDIPLEDEGTYDRNGNNLAFESGIFLDEFTGSVAGRTLTIHNYDAFGDGDRVAIVFQR